MSKQTPTNKQKSSSTHPKIEIAGAAHCARLVAYCREKNARFFVDELSASPYVDLDGSLIEISPESILYTQLLLRAVNLTCVSAEAKSATLRFAAHALTESRAGKLFKHSGVSEDGKSILVASTDPSYMIAISQHEIKHVPNGSDGIHVIGNGFRIIPAGLNVYELVVETIPAADALKWFLAMVPLFVLARHFISTRPIIQISGESQAGKTTSARKLLEILNLGPNLLTDATVSFARALGDCGAICLDNRESGNSLGWGDFLLTAASGGTFGRSSSGGQIRRHAASPVVLVTSIEGLRNSRELSLRILDVPLSSQYRSGGGMVAQSIRAIVENRDLIANGLFTVLQEFLRVGLVEELDSPISQVETWSLFCCLIRAYAAASKRPASWADDLIAAWRSHFAGDGDEDGANDEVEDAIVSVLRVQDSFWATEAFSYRGTPGRMFIVTVGRLFAELRKDPTLGRLRPRNSSALGRRLSSMRPKSFRILYETDAPRLLKRTNSVRPIGLWLDEDQYADIHRDFGQFTGALQ